MSIILLIAVESRDEYQIFCQIVIITRGIHPSLNQKNVNRSDPHNLYLNPSCTSVKETP